MFVPIRPAMRQIEIDGSEACDQSLSPMSDQGSMMIVCACASRGRGRALARARPRSVITHTHTFFFVRAHYACARDHSLTSKMHVAVRSLFNDLPCIWILRLMVVQSQHLEVDWVTSDTGQRALRMAKLAMPLSKLATGHHAVRHPRAPKVNSLLARTAVDLFN